MIDPVSLGYGVFLGACLVSGGGWAWFHFWPVDRTRDAYELAKKRKGTRRENTQRGPVA